MKATGPLQKHIYIHYQISFRQLIIKHGSGLSGQYDLVKPNYYSMHVDHRPSVVP